MAVKVLTKDNFDAETASGVSLVDFWASWCGPCRMMSPVVDGLSEKVERLNVCKVNVDDEPDLADRFGIDMIPALIFIKTVRKQTDSSALQVKISLYPPQRSCSDACAPERRRRGCPCGEGRTPSHRRLLSVPTSAYRGLQMHLQRVPRPDKR